MGDLGPALRFAWGCRGWRARVPESALELASTALLGGRQDPRPAFLARSRKGPTMHHLFATARYQPVTREDQKPKQASPHESGARWRS